MRLRRFLMVLAEPGAAFFESTIFDPEWGPEWPTNAGGLLGGASEGFSDGAVSAEGDDGDEDGDGVCPAEGPSPAP